MSARSIIVLFCTCTIQSSIWDSRRFRCAYPCYSDSFSYLHPLRWSGVSAYVEFLLDQHTMVFGILHIVDGIGMLVCDDVVTDSFVMFRSNCSTDGG